MAGRASDTVAGTGSTAQANAATGAGGTSGGTSTGTGSGTSIGTGTSTATNGPAASSTQQAGIVTVVSTLGYQSAESAGTGIVLTSDGEILTNNHVVDGATSDHRHRRVDRTDVHGHGRRHRPDRRHRRPAARRRRRAHHGQVATSTPSAAVGDTVVGVGNAGGTGTPSAATGTVTALSQSITATDESGGNAETLTGLIETDAHIVAGDSGGPLYDAAGT